MFLGQVAPHAGARIETLRTYHPGGRSSVAPHAGARIETRTNTSAKRRIMSLLTQERGLKPGVSGRFRCVSLSLLTQERGLKPFKRPAHLAHAVAPQPAFGHRARRATAHSHPGGRCGWL